MQLLNLVDKRQKVLDTFIIQLMTVYTTATHVLGTDKF